MTALLSGLSPLIFPAWLHLPEAKPLPAEFAGSRRHSSPSTTARWQSMRGGIHLSQKEIIKAFLLNLKHSTSPAHSMLLLMLMTNYCPLDFLWCPGISWPFLPWMIIRTFPGLLSHQQMTWMLSSFNKNNMKKYNFWIKITIISFISIIVGIVK